MKTAWIFQGKFSSAHLYFQKNWSEEKNREEFGRCFTEHGHGHNYRLEVEIEGPTEAPPRDWAQFVFEECDRFDHQHLNFDLPEFQNLIPTTENIALVLTERLEKRLGPNKLRRLRLWEMDDLSVEIQR